MLLRSFQSFAHGCYNSKKWRGFSSEEFYGGLIKQNDLFKNIGS